MVLPDKIKFAKNGLLQTNVKMGENGDNPKKRGVVIRL